MVLSKFIPIITIVFLSVLCAQEEVAILSNRVGTMIDKDENFYYKIFSKEKYFVNAQLYRLSDDRYRVKITKKIDGEEKIVWRYINLKTFAVLQNKVNGREEMTPALLKEMTAGMDFLRTEKILKEIPKPQFVALKHSGSKKLKGSLIKVEKNILFIQTPTTLEKIKLSRVDALSYRESISGFDHLRIPVMIGTSFAGLGVAYLLNSNRSTLYNEYGIPRNDLKRYTQISGIVIGLIFSSELFDAMSTLLTPKETIILSENEYNKKNKN